MENQILWTPSQDQIANSNLTAFAKAIEGDAGQVYTDYADLHRWSVDNREAFWRAVWDFGSVIGDRSGPELVDGAQMPGAKFFPEAQLNYAENLRRNSGNGAAIIFRPEAGKDVIVSHNDLRAHVSRAQQALKAAGVQAGDRVAGLLPNIPGAAIYMLAATSLGAVWSSCSPDFGEGAVLDRFAQIEPKVLISVPGYTYKAKPFDITDKVRSIAAQLPGLTKTVLLPYPAGEVETDFAVTESTFLDGFEAQEPEFTRVPFNAPLFILFSSGTTGTPKCIMHGVGGTLLQHIKEHQLHADIHPGDRLFYFSTCSWMMWNWQMTALASGAALIIFDGNPSFPNADTLWQMSEDLGVTHFGTSAKYIDALRKADATIKGRFDLSALRVILSTGSPLSATNFSYTYDAIHDDVLLASISGGTDIVSCFLGGCPWRPVRAGELQAAGLGMDVDVVDPSGNSVTGATGELVCRQAFPSMPVGFWGDDGTRYKKAYFETVPGMWCQSDVTEHTPADGFIVHGRSDSTLNPGGVRIGTAEIYRAVEYVEGVFDCVVVGRNTEDDVEVVLFVQLASGVELTDDLTREIKTAIKTRCTPRHIPAHVFAVSDIPRTRNGKTSEAAARQAVNGQEIANTGQLENPALLEEYRRFQ